MNNKTRSEAVPSNANLCVAVDASGKVRVWRLVIIGLGTDAQQQRPHTPSQRAVHQTADCCKLPELRKVNLHGRAEKCAIWEGAAGSKQPGTGKS